MKYYKLKFNIAEQGYVPQDKEIIGQYNFDAPNAFRHFHYNDNLESLWVPSGIMLRHQAKYSDFLNLNNAPNPYLVLSSRLFKLISDYRLPNHQTFNLSIVKREKSVNYIIFISKVCFAEYLDFNTCQFYTYNFDAVQGPHNKTPIKISNAQTYWEILNNTVPPLYLGGTNIALDTSAIEYDIFRLPRALGGANYIVSETLAEAVNQAGFTGIQFVPFET